jgi:hypothetical protein
METTRNPQFKQQYKHLTLQLSERDLAILKTVFEYRFADSNQLRALFGDAITRAPNLKRYKGAEARHPDQAITARLTSLYHHDYLDRPRAQRAMQPITGGRRPFIYALGNRGAKALAEHFALDSKEALNWQRKNATIQYPFLFHTLMIGNFRGTLELATKNNPNVELVRWEHGQQLRRMLVEVNYPSGAAFKRKRIPVYPDGLFSLRFPSMPEKRNMASFFLEADRSNETHTYFLRKVLAYRQYYNLRKHMEHYHIPEFRVLTVTISKERRDKLREFIAANLTKMGATSTDRVRFLFATEKDFDMQSPETLFKPIWYGLKDDQPIAISPQFHP